MPAQEALNGTPQLCTITQTPGHGGIARVSVLLWHVLRDLYGDRYSVVQLLPGKQRPVTPLDKALFARRVLWDQIRGATEWLLFDHVGLARVQSAVPRFARQPYAVFLHSVEVWRRLDGHRLAVLRNARVRLANSHYTVERFLSMNSDVGPIEVCHLSVPPATASEVGCDSALSVVDEALVRRVRPNSVLIVGRTARQEGHKGHDRLIRAWPLVTAEVPDAQLVILGSGDQLPDLMKFAGEVQLGENVLFTGHVSEATLHAIYSRAAVFAMPSCGEGFGLVFLEAMQHGLPCIGSREDATREIVVDGLTGFLAEPSDIQGLACSIVTLLQNPRLRAEMGRCGLRRVQSEFCFERFKNRVSTALEPLTSHDTQNLALRRCF